jgi:antitoxin VapB
MIWIAPETEVLARELAEKQGVPVEEAIKSAIERAAREVGIEQPIPASRTPEEIMAGIEAIARRCAARPVHDARVPDEIIGYDEFGVPR